jgi:two-component system sensor histidine kinase KdpD
MASLAGVALVTWIATSVIRLNATTVGFAYLLLVLVIATFWGFSEASAASFAATLTLNLYFLPPVGRLTIADPQNWVALFSFLATSIVASQLSAKAKRRELDAIARQQDVERLYTFSRAILLIEKSESFPTHLVRKIAEVFELSAVVLYERRSEEMYRAGPSDFKGMDDQLRETALHGTSFADSKQSRTITAIRLGSEPIAALALQGKPMPDSVLQGVANLAAIGLERYRAQDLESQVEAAKQSEKLRTSLLDAMAHEFKTPLTSVLAATSALLSDPNQAPGARTELLKIADEEAHRLQELIDDAVEMGRLDSSDIRVQAELADVGEIARDVVDSMRNEMDERPVEVERDPHVPAIAVDRRLVRLAIKQLVDNALKYSPHDKPVLVRVSSGKGAISVSVTDHGTGIPRQEQARIFQRLYRSPSVAKQIPGSGLGLSIALNIVRAHHGDLNVTSGPGETTFELTLPMSTVGAPK